MLIHSFTIRVLNGRRSELREHMKDCGVDTGVHWQAGHTFTYLKNCRQGDLSVTVSSMKFFPCHYIAR